MGWSLHRVPGASRSVTGQRAIVVGGIACGIAVLDQVTKSYVRAHMDVGEAPIKLVPFFDLRYVQNRGVAFSLLSGHQELVLVAVALVFTLLVVLVVRTLGTDIVSLVGIASILGGAIGNVIDRVRLGFVTDFLHISHWPTFNVADIGIVVGVGLLLLRQLRPPAGSTDEA